MKTIDLMYSTMVSELEQRALDDAFATDFPVNGSILTNRSKGKEYFYYQPNGEGRRLYVGPAADPEIAKRVEEFAFVKGIDTGRRKIVQTLTRQVGLPKPEREIGDVVAAMAEAGFFRMRGVLVGTVAYGCYAAHLGVKLPAQSLTTQDVDFAQFKSVSAAVGDSLPPMIELLKKIDPKFREVPSQTDGRRCTQYTSGTLKVEFLTPHQGSDDETGRPAPMPSLGGASAFPLRFMDFLIHSPVRTVMLHGAGVPVTIPAPERFAIHKLILAARRSDEKLNLRKVDKDLLQATSIIKAMIEKRMTDDLAMAWAEAWDRGPKWRHAISTGLSLMEDASRNAVLDGLAKGMLRLGNDPDGYGIATSVDVETDVSSSPKI